MKSKIKHLGIVDNIDGGCVRVRIVQSSACAACHAAGKCNAAESKVKMVDVRTDDTSGLHEGDTVTVSADSGTGTLAVMVCAVMPLVVLVAVLAMVLATTGNEAAAALSGIAALIPYYIMVYLMRGKISEKVVFRLEER